MELTRPSRRAVVGWSLVVLTALAVIMWAWFLVHGLPGIGKAIEVADDGHAEIMAPAALVGS